MKLPLSICFVLSALSVSGFAITRAPSAAPPPELTALKEQHEHDLTARTRAGQEQYIASLNKLLASTTQLGDKNGTKAVQKELMQMGVDVHAAPDGLLGTWEFKGQGWSLTRAFHKDGSVTGSEMRDPEARWVADPEKVTIFYHGNTTHTLYLPLDPNGTKARSGHGKIITATRKP